MRNSKVDYSNKNSKSIATNASTTTARSSKSSFGLYNNKTPQTRDSGLSDKHYISPNSLIHDDKIKCYKLNQSH